MVTFPAVLVCEYLLYLPAVYFFGFRLKALLGFCITTLVKLCKDYFLFALHPEEQNSILSAVQMLVLIMEEQERTLRVREFTDHGSKYQHCQKVHHPTW